MVHLKERFINNGYKENVTKGNMANLKSKASNRNLNKNYTVKNASDLGNQTGAIFSNKRNITTKIEASLDAFKSS